MCMYVCMYVCRRDKHDQLFALTDIVYKYIHSAYVCIFEYDQIMATAHSDLLCPILSYRILSHHFFIYLIIPFPILHYHILHRKPTLAYRLRVYHLVLGTVAELTSHCERMQASERA